MYKYLLTGPSKRQHGAYSRQWWDVIDGWREGWRGRSIGEEPGIGGAFLRANSFPSQFGFTFSIQFNQLNQLNSITPPLGTSLLIITAVHCLYCQITVTSRPLRPLHPAMSLANLAHVCSHLNNVNKARLSIASIPNTKLHLKLCLALLNQGVISTVVRGGMSPPPPHLLLGHPTMDDGMNVDVPSTEPVTQSNISSRRLWLGLKYWQNEPVMGKLVPVSKPKRKIDLTVSGIRELHRGNRHGMVDGLRSPGELLFVLTNLGLMESRQCLERNVGGMALCRMN